MMTPEEKAKVQEETRQECAMIAAIESRYWSSLDSADADMYNICLGGIGAAANICAAFFMGKTLQQFSDEVAGRDKARYG